MPLVIGLLGRYNRVINYVIIAPGVLSMGKFSNFIIGSLVGTAAGVAISYLFAPSQGTTFDENYRSRWDWALEEGQKAADERERELRRQFDRATQ